MKQKIKLHHSLLKNEGDPEVTKHSCILDLVMYLYGVFLQKVENKSVYLLSFYDEVNKKDLIFVSEYPDLIIDLIRRTYSSFDACYASDIHVQEYDSYEEAYRVALLMMEPNKLCYTDKNHVKLFAQFKN